MNAHHKNKSTMRMSATSDITKIQYRTYGECESDYEYEYECLSFLQASKAAGIETGQFPQPSSYRYLWYSSPPSHPIFI